MGVAAELGRNPASKHQIQTESSETKFSGTHGDRGILIFPVQLTTSRISNLTRLIDDTLLYVMYVFVFFPFILDIKFVGRTSRGHT